MLNLKGALVGTTIAPGDTVLQTVPETNDLIVTGQIRPIDIESARLSREARVVLADPRAQCSEFLGSIGRISASVLQPSADVEPYYEVALRLEAKKVESARKMEPAKNTSPRKVSNGEVTTDLRLDQVDDFRKASLIEPFTTLRSLDRYFAFKLRDALWSDRLL